MTRTEASAIATAIRRAFRVIESAIDSAPPRDYEMNVSIRLRCSVGQALPPVSLFQGRRNVDQLPEPFHQQRDGIAGLLVLERVTQFVERRDAQRSVAEGA